MVNFPTLNAELLNCPEELFNLFLNTVCKVRYQPQGYIMVPSTSTPYKWINGVKTQVGPSVTTMVKVKNRNQPEKTETGDTLALGLRTLDRLINLIGERKIEKIGNSFHITIAGTRFNFNGQDYDIKPSKTIVEPLSNGDVKVIFADGKYEIYSKVDSTYLTSMFAFVYKDENQLVNRTIINGVPYTDIDVTTLKTPWPYKTYIFRWYFDGNEYSHPYLPFTSIIQFDKSLPNSRFVNINPINSDKGNYDVATHTFNYPTLNTTEDCTYVKLQLEFYPYQFKQPADERYYVLANFTDKFPEGPNLVLPSKGVDPNAVNYY